jgi:peptidoglycan/LPS O-acetylase OafA/YrhL
VIRPSFDDLATVRGLAAIVVLLSHVVQVHFLRFTGLNTPLHWISSIASEYAVVVFFILSGYLIAHTLEANIKRNGTLRLDVYVIARIARIYPPFLYSIGVSLTVFFILDVFELPGRSSPMRLPTDLYASRDFVHLSFHEIKKALFMFDGLLEINGPLWSLYIEVKLYILFACALALVTKRSITQKILLVMVFYYLAKSGLALNPAFVGCAAVWLTGSIAYYVIQGGGRARLILCGGLIVITAICYLLKRIEISPWIVGREILITASITLLLFRVKLSTWVPMSRRLSDCSYSLYVTHFPVLLLAQSLLIYTNSTSVIAAGMLAILSIAAAASVAFIGGIIEAKKSMVQNGILTTLRRIESHDAA